ncbi:hypothetical protein AB0I34_22920 [Kribbella sp. NPDC050281]
MEQHLADDIRQDRLNGHGRAEAQAHGRELGIPEPQLDWTD